MPEQQKQKRSFNECSAQYNKASWSYHIHVYIHSFVKLSVFKSIWYAVVRQAWHAKHNEQCTHSTQGIWGGIPSQPTNKKLSMNRICTSNTLNFFCNWRILGTSICPSTCNQTPHAQSQSHSHTILLGTPCTPYKAFSHAKWSSIFKFNDPLLKYQDKRDQI